MSRPDAIFYSIAFYSYLAGFLAYIIHVALKLEWSGKVAIGLMALGVLPHTAAFFLRWSTQGHIPLANMFEYMGLMSWMVVVALLYFSIRYKNLKIGVFISPVAVMLLVVASLLPSETSGQLMPALQSTWLTIHVTLAALGSGAFLVAFAASALYLLSPEVKDSKSSIADGRYPTAHFVLFWVVTPIVTYLLLHFAGILPQTIGSLSGGHLHNGTDSAITAFAVGVGTSSLYCGRIIIGLGIGMVLGALLWPLVQRQQVASGKKTPSTGRFFVVLILALLLSAVLIGFLIRDGFVRLTPRSYFKIFEFFGAVLAVSWVMTPLLHLFLVRLRGGWITRLGVSRTVLEDVSYAAVAIGYPLYTVGALFAGAIWAEQAWGSWWSWDPKEVGALIIWLFYTGFLHARYQQRWRGTPAAMLVVLGMVMIFLSFFGNYFFGGLHSFEVT